MMARDFEQQAIHALMRPSSIALIGASADPSKTSGLPVRFLKKHGYQGKIFPVNPRVAEIDGLTCYADIGSLPECPEVGMVLLGAERSIQAVAELAKAGTKAAIILASGFAESGDEGRARQDALRKAAGSMRLLGPNTIGLVNVTDKIPLSASGALAMDHFAAGKVSVISQSGGILGSLLSRAAARGLGLSKLVSTSNEVDLDVSDFLSYLVDDPATQVIVLYIEAIRDAEKFRVAAMKAKQNGKPVVALKIGRSEAGARAAVSHTGAMAGSDRVYDEFFRECGVIRAQTFGELLDIPTTLSSQPAVKGNRVAIVTSTGGAGTLVSDALGMAGFETPAPDAATLEKMRTYLPNPDIALDHNPIDVTLAGLQNEILTGIVGALSTSPSYDALVVIVGSSGVARPDLLANAVAAAMPTKTVPVLAYVSPHAPAAASRLTELGVPAFSEPESVASSLRALREIASPPVSRSVTPPSNVSLPPDLHGSLDEAAAKSVFELFGIRKAPEVVVETAAQAQAAAEQLGGPVVLKILSGEITHKSDVGGVAVGLTSETIADAFTQMKAQVARATGKTVSRFLVQKMVRGGVELIIGFNRDPLGDTIMLGMGGVTAELLKDTTIRLLPRQGGLSIEEAKSMVDDLKMGALLKGHRGRLKADIEALALAIVGFSQLVHQFGGRLVEAEINPVFVLPEGEGIYAADGVLILE